MVYVTERARRFTDQEYPGVLQKRKSLGAHRTERARRNTGQEEPRGSRNRKNHVVYDTQRTRRVTDKKEPRGSRPDRARRFLECALSLSPD